MLKKSIKLLLLLALIILSPAQIEFPRHLLVGKSYPYQICYPKADSISAVFFYHLRSPDAYYQQSDTTAHSDTLRSSFCTSKEGHWKLKLFIWYGDSLVRRDRQFFVGH